MVAEPLKDRFGPDVPVRIAAMIESVHPGFRSAEFVARALEGYDDLELTPRARQIADALAEHLPADPEEALARLRLWARDPNVRVRRLVSEGTRPRLPWAKRLRRFQEDPAPVVALLELLKDDPEPYVRRSVANILNDIAKDHPDVIVALGRRWLDGASSERRALVAHGLRTLVKQGHAGALAVLGYEPGSPIVVDGLSATPETVAIGGRVRVEVDLRNPDVVARSALVDLRVHFVKANGSLRPKVFKGATIDLDPGAIGRVRKSVSLAQHTTRTHYPGRHRVEALVNGATVGSAWFTVT